MNKKKKCDVNNERCSRRKKKRNDVWVFDDLCVMTLKDRAGKVAVTVIDTEDYGKVESHRWYLSKMGYAMSGTKIRPLAATILGVETNRNSVVDHINRNKLDNRRGNLRVVSKSENAFNSRRRTDNKSGHRGVSWDKTRNKWKAQICIKGKVIPIGRYDSIEEAITARKGAESSGGIDGK